MILRKIFFYNTPCSFLSWIYIQWLLDDMAEHSSSSCWNWSPPSVIFWWSLSADLQRDHFSPNRCSLPIIRICFPRKTSRGVIKGVIFRNKGTWGRLHMQVIYCLYDERNDPKNFQALDLKNRNSDGSFTWKNHCGLIGWWEWISTLVLCGFHHTIALHFGNVLFIVAGFHCFLYQIYTWRIIEMKDILKKSDGMLHHICL